MKFDLDICGTFTVNCNNFVDSLTFHLAPSSCLWFMIKDLHNGIHSQPELYFVFHAY